MSWRQLGRSLEAGLLALLCTCAVLGGCESTSPPQTALVDAPAPDAGSEGPCGPPPTEGCYCLTETDSFSYEDCCNTKVCNCQPRMGTWQRIECDPPPVPLLDAATDAATDAAAFDATSPP